MLAWETGDAELPKFGETSNLFPRRRGWQSRAKPGGILREGVETRRAAPKPRMFRETVKG